MAGAGSRFSLAGYDKPKPFIDVNGKPMIVRVLENLAYPNARYYLLVRKEHMDAETALIESIKKEFNVLFLPIDKATEGTACTVLYARKHINNNDSLIIANSDQIVDINITHFIDDCKQRNLDGSILTFNDINRDPKWSFARLDEFNYVSEVKEKEVISDYATVGIYLFNKGKYFVDAAIDMIIASDRVNNEFYTCPAYNYAIKSGLKFGIFNIPQNKMHGLGTPEDLNYYINILNK